MTANLIRDVPNADPTYAQFLISMHKLALWKKELLFIIITVDRILGVGHAYLNSIAHSIF